MMRLLSILAVPLLISAVILSAQEEISFTYDAFGRLVGADYGGGNLLTYTYDGRGNMVGQGTYADPNPTADVEVTLSALPDPVQAGSNLVYMITASNLGAVPAPGVTVEDPLPGTMLQVDETLSQGELTVTGSVLNWAAGLLAPGKSASLEVVIKPFIQGEVTNTVLAVHDGTDPDPGNNTGMVVTVVTQAQDEDSDGLPDWWEDFYYGSTTGAVVSSDTDGDGVDAWGEYLADTDPLDGASFLYVDRVERQGATLVIFPTSPIRTYDVDYSGQVVDDMGWTNLQQDISGDGEDAQVSDPAGGTDPYRVYRVRARP